MNETMSTAVVAIDDEEELLLLRSVGEETGASIETMPMRDLGMSAVLVAGAVLAVAKTVERYLDRRAEARRGGQVIEVQGDRVIIRRDLDLRADVLVVHGPDGTLTVKAVDDNVELRTLYSAVARVALTAGQAGTDALRASLEAAVGGTASITETADKAGS